MQRTKHPAGVAARLGATVFWLVGALAAGASASPAGAAGAGRAQTAAPSSRAKVDLAISNVQYCRQAPCQWPTETAYRRGVSGPLAGSDNLNKFVTVSPGETITWTYQDTAAGGPEVAPGQRLPSTLSCDFYGTPPFPEACHGHAVALENGTAAGSTLGFLPARSGAGSITWVVPADAKPGSLIRYFCNVVDPILLGGQPHWNYGMTGGLRVVTASAEGN